MSGDGDDWDKETIPSTQIGTPTKYSFEKKEINTAGKRVVTIYGNKGEGKTTAAFLFPGSISALSFDNKTIHPKRNYFGNDARIKVYNAVEYLSPDSEEYTKSSMQTYEYCKFLLKRIAEEDKPDWILIDGMEVISQIGEMVMRHKHNLAPFQAFANRGLWKERRLVIRTIHKLALDAAKVGVIYTTYIEKDEIVEEGTTISKQDIPKWIDVVMTETDIVLRVLSSHDKLKGHKVYIKVKTSKFDKWFKTGTTLDITEKKSFDFQDKS